MESLAQVKLALDAGLITEIDYAQAKAAFLRAQQIRAGFEAGLLTAADSDYVKKAFISCLDTLHASQPIVDLGGSHDISEVADLAAADLNDEDEVEAELEEVAAAVVLEVDDEQLGGEVAVNGDRARVDDVDDGTDDQPLPTPSVVINTAAHVSDSTPPTPPPTPHPTPQPKVPAVASSSPAKPATSFGRSVSGVGMADECLTAFRELQARSAYQYILFKINEQHGQVQLDEAGAAGSSYSSFVEALPQGDCRYAVYDFKYVNTDGCEFNKIVFVMWSPDNSPLKHKMLYASSKDYFRQQLTGVAMEMQVTDEDEIEEQCMFEKVRDTLTRK